MKKALTTAVEDVQKAGSQSVAYARFYKIMDDMCTHSISPVKIKLVSSANKHFRFKLSLNVCLSNQFWNKKVLRKSILYSGQRQ